RYRQISAVPKPGPQDGHGDRANDSAGKMRSHTACGPRLVLLRRFARGRCSAAAGICLSRLFDFGRLQIDGRRTPAGAAVRLTRHAVLKAVALITQLPNQGGYWN